MILLLVFCIYTEQNFNNLLLLRDIKDLSKQKDLLNKCICMLTRDGKKSIAERIVQKSFYIIREKAKKNPTVVFAKAVHNVQPLFELRNVRISGKPHAIPALIPLLRQQSIALRWIIQSARNFQHTNKNKSPKISFSFILAKHILDASKKRGEAFQKKINLHKTGELNRAFLHKRWW